MASNKAKEFWKKGVPIGRAWETFASKALSSKLEQSQTFTEAIGTNSILTDLLGLGKAITASLNTAQYKRNIEKEIKDYLLDQLFNDQLVATGNREAPSAGRVPVIIYPSKFEYDDPDWDHHTLTVHGYRYGQIRISNHNPISNDIDARPKGAIDAIDRAIVELTNYESEFCDLPRKIACNKVRNCLGYENKTGNGLSDENISKRIVQKCGSKRIHS